MFVSEAFLEARLLPSVPCSISKLFCERPPTHRLSHRSYLFRRSRWRLYFCCARLDGVRTKRSHLFQSASPLHLTLAWKFGEVPEVFACCNSELEQATCFSPIKFPVLVSRYSICHILSSDLAAFETKRSAKATFAGFMGQKEAL